MRILSDDGEISEVSLLLTHAELRGLADAAERLQLSQDETHVHVNDETYGLEITLVLAAKRTRNGFNEMFNALVERIDPET